MKTGIIILNYNDYETTYDMLNRIKNFKEIDIIVVVDNMSLDNSYERLKKIENEKIKVISSNENKGYASGNNVGIKYLVNNYKVDNIIISNPDIVLKDSDIKILKDDLKNNKNIDIISPYIDERGKISKGWKLPRYIDELLCNMNFFHKIGENNLKYKDDYYKNDLTKVDAVSGCFFMIRKESFEKIGYFDENTFLYYEENIIGKKLKDNNMNTYVDKRVNIIHNLSISVNKSFNSIKKYKILKQSQKYYQKEYNKLNIFGMILLRFVYYISLIISYIVCFFRNFGGKR